MDDSKWHQINVFTSDPFNTSLCSNLRPGSPSDVAFEHIEMSKPEKFLDVVSQTFYGLHNARPPTPPPTPTHPNPHTHTAHTRTHSHAFSNA